MNAQRVATPTTCSESLHGSTVNVTAENEHNLISDAKSGDSGAFGELYERHRMRIYLTAFRILRSPEDAEDAAQRGESRFLTWLTRIAINEALMILRQRRSNARLFDCESREDLASPLFSLADNGPTPEEILAATELRALIIQTVSQLRTTLRSVALRQLQGLTIAETARQLCLSVGAAKARSFHAKRYLRQYLERRLQAGRGGFREKGAELQRTLFGLRKPIAESGRLSIGRS